MHHQTPPRILSISFPLGTTSRTRINIDCAKHLPVHPSPRVMRRAWGLLTILDIEIFDFQKEAHPWPALTHELIHVRIYVRAIRV